MASYHKRLRKLRPKVSRSLCALPPVTRQEGPRIRMKGGCRRKLLEMEEEGIGTFGAPVWEGTDTIWQRERCLGARQLGEARGGGAELDSERRCRRRVNHGARRCLRSARPCRVPRPDPAHAFPRLHNSPGCSGCRGSSCGFPCTGGSLAPALPMALS